MATDHFWSYRVTLANDRFYGLPSLAPERDDRDCAPFCHSHAISACLEADIPGFEHCDWLEEESHPSLDQQPRFVSVSRCAT